MGEGRFYIMQYYARLFNGKDLSPTCLAPTNFYTGRPLNNTYLWVLKTCPLLGGNLTKITFGTNCFVRYPINVCYLGCPLLGGFTV